MTAPKMSDVFALPLLAPSGEFVWSRTGHLVATFHGLASMERAPAAIRAINSHDALVEAIEGYLAAVDTDPAPAHCPDPPFVTKFRRALAAAKEE